MVKLSLYFNILLAIYEKFSYQCVLFLYDTKFDSKYELKTSLKQFMLHGISVATMTTDFRKLSLNKKDLCFKPLIIGIGNDSSIMENILKNNFCENSLKWILITNTSLNFTYKNYSQICRNFMKLESINSTTILIQESIPNTLTPLYWILDYGFTRNFSPFAYETILGIYLSQNIKPSEYKDTHYAFTTNLWLKHRINLLNTSIQVIHSENEIEPMFIKNEVDIVFNLINFETVVNNSFNLLPMFYFRAVFILAEQPKSNVVWNIFLLPFTKKLWIFLICNFLFMSIILTILYRFVKIGNLNFINCFTVIACFCGKGFLEPATMPSQKIILITLNITIYCIWVAYNAILYSFFSVNIQTKPFQNDTELLNDKKYTVAANQYDMENDLIKENYNFTIHNFQIFNVSNANNWMQRVCHEFYGILTILKYLYDQRSIIPKCPYYEVYTNITTLKSFQIHKNSPLRDLINQYMIAISQFGYRMHHITLIQPKFFRNNVLKEISFELITPILTVFSSLVLISIVLFGFEIIWFKIFLLKL